MGVKQQQVAELLLTTVGQFKGDFPDVPPAPDIDMEALTKDDPDPFFVTLPLMEVGAVSQNVSLNSKGQAVQRKYGWEAAETLVQQINQEHPGGIQGHLKTEERSTRYEPDALQWVGALLEGNTVYGKAYVPTYQPEVRGHLAMKKAVNAKVGTSLYGTAAIADDGTVREIDYETIDLGHPKRLGLKGAAATPKITKETVDDETTKEDDVGGDTTFQETLLEQRDQYKARINELEQQVSELATLRGQVEELTAARDEGQTRITELEGQVSELETAQKDAEAAQAIREMVVNEFADVFTNARIEISAGGENFAEVIRELIEKLQELNAQSLLADADAAVEELVQIEALRPLVLEQLGLPAPGENGERQATSETVGKLAGLRGDALKTRIEEIVELPHMKAVAEALVAKSAGPGAVVIGSANGGHSKSRLEQIQELIDKGKEARSRIGM